MLTLPDGGRIVAQGGFPLPPLSQHERTDVTELLMAWREGDESAASKLLPIVYDELHRCAARAMQRESVGHTLQPTALVNEVYLRLVDQTRAVWQNRAQFFGVAAQLMRRILVDHARSQAAEKRGGGQHAVTLDELRDAIDRSSGPDAIQILELNDALIKLEALDPDQARVVELRYFTGLSIEETAEALGVSVSTVKREWIVARAWLRRELS